MVKSAATMVDEYLRQLPKERRAVIAAVRRMVLENLPAGYRESLGFGMIIYEVPLQRYPNTYNGQPLCYMGLAAQKNHYALYLMGAYQDPRQVAWLRQEFKKAGKRLDMGKSCLRFKGLDDLPMDVIARAVSSVPAETFIARYERSRRPKSAER
jgi:hypothetical protein